MNRNPTKKRLLALCLTALVVLLSGCGGGNRAVIQLDPDDGLYESGQIQTYAEQNPGYYAPETGAVGDAPVAPAPAAPSLDDIRTNAEQQAITDPDYETASQYTTIGKGDVNMGIVVGENMVINPLRCKYQDMMNLNTLVFESLVSLDVAMQPVPELADRWTSSGDSWEFTLRTGVTFQDGSVLSPEDVIASWQEIKRNQDSYWYPLVNMIDSITAKDEATVVVKGQPGYVMLYAMTFPIVQRNSIEDARPVGTGPYLIAQYDTSTAVRLAKNPLWWKKSTDQVESIVGVCFPTAKAAVTALEMGQIDTLASEYPTASVNRTLSDRMTKDYSTLTYECIVPNLSRGLLKSLPVRQALMYAIDRSSLANTVYTGMVQETEVPVVPQSFLYEPQAAQYNYSPERAYKILQDAGWVYSDSTGYFSKEIDGVITPLELRLLTYDRGTTSTRTEAIEAIQAQLQLVGIKVSTATFTLGEAHQRMNDGDFDLALCAFELSEIPNLQFLLGSSGSSNYARYKNAEMDKLLKTAYEARSAEDLQVAMSDIQLKIVNELPILGLFFRNGVISSSVPLQLSAGTRRGYVLNGVATSSAN